MSETCTITINLNGLTEILKMTNCSSAAFERISQVIRVPSRTAIPSLVQVAVTREVDLAEHSMTMSPPRCEIWGFCRNRGGSPTGSGGGSVMHLLVFSSIS